MLEEEDEPPELEEEPSIGGLQNGVRQLIFVCANSPPLLDSSLLQH